MSILFSKIKSRYKFLTMQCDDVTAGSFMTRLQYRACEKNADIYKARSRWCRASRQLQLIRVYYVHPPPTQVHTYTPSPITHHPSPTPDTQTYHLHLSPTPVTPPPTAKRSCVSWCETHRTCQNTPPPPPSTHTHTEGMLVPQLCRWASRRVGSLASKGRSPCSRSTDWGTALFAAFRAIHLSFRLRTTSRASRRRTSRTSQGGFSRTSRRRFFGFRLRNDVREFLGKFFVANRRCP